ncbi:MAG: hypothetical protein FWE20_06000 [Defluviitaleaceae bacterium]|nr:hypothetical protein [Defluviitaleaceae bacterium]
MDLSAVNHEFNELGNTRYRMNSDKYQNSFKEMADGVNNMLEQQVNVVMGTIDILNKINDGEFDAKIDDLPGDMIILTQTVREVIAQLKEAHCSMVYIAENATEGILDVKVDPSKFKGVWSELIKALNNLLSAIEEPLASIEVSLLETSEGNFELSQLNRKFKGIFESLRKGVHDTEVSTLGYIEDITYVLEHMAQGDLTVSIERDFLGSYAPIKTALTTIINSLNDTLSDIHGAVEQVASGADQISTSAMHLAEGLQGRPLPLKN